MGRKRSRSSLGPIVEKKIDPEEQPLIPDDQSIDHSDSEEISEHVETNESDQEKSEEEEIVQPTSTLKFEEDSDEEIALDENTVGEVPMHWYDEYDHIGYNIVGNKIARPARKDLMDSFLDREDNSNWLVDQKINKKSMIKKLNLKRFFFLF